MFQQQVLAIYESIREQENRALQNRKEEIETRIPKILQIDDEINKLHFKLTMLSIRKPLNLEEECTLVKNQITDLKVRKYELLVENGYPQDYLELHYNCNVCKDTGFILNNKCECYKKHIAKIYYDNSDLPQILDDCNLDNFSFEYYSDVKDSVTGISAREKMQKVLRTITKYVDDFSNINKNLLMYGGTGTGKTFTINCIAKKLIDEGNFVVYRTSHEIMSDFRKIAFEGNKTLQDIIINCDLLIIDDLGTETTNEFVRTELLNLINSKIIKNKKMIITTNLTSANLKEVYSERVVSRLVGEFTFIRFYGEDIRINKKYSV